MIVKFNENLPNEITEKFSNIYQSCQVGNCIILATKNKKTINIYFLKNNKVVDKNIVSKNNLSFSMDSSKNVLLVDDVYMFPYAIFNIEREECYFANFIKDF